MQAATANRWETKSGLAFLVFGLFFISPFTDLLPVDFWVFVETWPESKEAKFYRVTTEQPDHISHFAVVGFFFIAIAFLLFATGRMRSTKR